MSAASADCSAGANIGNETSSGSSVYNVYSKFMNCLFSLCIQEQRLEPSGIHSEDFQAVCKAIHNSFLKKMEQYLKKEYRLDIHIYFTCLFPACYFFPKISFLYRCTCT